MPLGLGHLDSSAYGVNNAVSLAASRYTESIQPQHEDHQPAYGFIAADYQSAPPAASSVSPAGPDAEPELRLIFRDGHQRSIRNYVLTGKTLIVLDNAAGGRQQRIPLADLDLPATEASAEAAGLEFIPPA